MNDLKYLLKEINILNQQIKNRKMYEDNFNLFDSMCYRYDEVHLHSRFLSILLDPHASHKMKDLFIKLFIEKLNIPFEYHITSLEVYPNEQNQREHKEIDLLLIDRKRQSAIIIENKIGADDSNHKNEGQIERYYRIITQDERIPRNSTFVIYLSIDREAPSNESISTSGLFPELKNKVLSIHYGIEILDWLKMCVKECYDRPVLRESIIQYIKLVKSMTNNNTSEEELKLLMQLIGKNQDNLMSAKRLIDNSKHIHWWMIYEFWKLLSEKFTDLGYVIRQGIENEKIDDLIHGSTQKKNKADFYLKLSTPSGINFTINNDHDNFICIGVMTEDVKAGLRTKAKSFFKSHSVSLCLEECEGWIFYKFFDFSDSDGLQLGNFCNELTFSLISDSCRKEVVDIIIKQSKKILTSYARTLK